MMFYVFGAIALLVAIVLYAIIIYNSLIQLRLEVREATADIETLLKKRFDLIPNMVNVVKGYAKHESGVFEKVTELRSKMGQGGLSMEDMSTLNNQMTSTLKTLFAVAESYPELKANANFLQLQQDLKDIETEIAKSRRYYNAIVGDYNTKIAVFPNVLFASALGFKEAQFFAIDEEERKNVTVQF